LGDRALVIATSTDTFEDGFDIEEEIGLDELFIGAGVGPDGVEAQGATEVMVLASGKKKGEAERGRGGPREPENFGLVCDDFILPPRRFRNGGGSLPGGGFGPGAVAMGIVCFAAKANVAAGGDFLSEGAESERSSSSRTMRSLRSSKSRRRPNARSSFWL